MRIGPPDLSRKLNELDKHLYTEKIQFCDHLGSGAKYMRNFPNAYSVAKERFGFKIKILTVRESEL